VGYSTNSNNTNAYVNLTATVSIPAAPVLDASNLVNTPWTKSSTNVFPTVLTTNVGIGTAAPAQKLDVVGNAVVSGSVGIGTTVPNAAAALDVSSTTKGLLPPRLSQTQRDQLTTAQALGAAQAGLLLYNTTTQALNAWNGTRWTEVLGSGTGSLSIDATPSTFDYTGAVQTYTVPANVTTVAVTARGAQGGAGTTQGRTAFISGGNGAEVRSLLAVTPGQVLSVYVGGMGGTAPNSSTAGAAGYNGGGIPGTGDGYGMMGGGGGGASDVRTGGTALGDRVVVAGGGGGGGQAVGGGGGAPNGADGATISGQPTPGRGATQTAGGNDGGTFGQGGSAYNPQYGGQKAGGGGGGGYYGGGFYPDFGGGGGGSSWVTPTGSSAIAMTAASNAGNGSVTIAPASDLTAAPAFNGANLTGVIKNQTTPQAGASFNIDGSGTVGGNLLAGGRVGIGTTAPRQLLDVTGSPTPAGGGTTSLLRLTRPTVQNVRYGAALEIALGNYGTSGGSANAQSAVDFRLSNGGTEDPDVTVMALRGNGNVGIGTSAPRGALDVAGPGDVYLTANPANSGGQSLYLPGHIFVAPFGGGTYSYIQARSVANQGFIFRTNSGGNYVDALTLSPAGYVGIGITGPAFPLDVQATATPANYNYGYLNGNGNVGYASNNTGPVSIRASGRIVAAEFNAVSDRRLKTVVGLSDRAADLALLNRLRITDYTMRDRVQFGNRAFKKVIAQEVEEVFPQAVHQQAGFLPDIYALATAVQALPGDSLVTLTLPAPGLPVAVVASQRLKLVGSTGDILTALARPAAAGTRTLTLRRTPALVAGGKVFVYGLEHADVRAVDYEALSMLNISATQELGRQVAELQQQNAALQAGRTADQAAAATDHASLLTLQAQVARLLGEGAQAQK
jgi:hypothetical protein